MKGDQIDPLQKKLLSISPVLLGLMDNLFWFWFNNSESFFMKTPKQPPTATTWCIIKHRKERPKNCSYPQSHYDKLNQYISSIINGIINLCNKKYISNITIDEKLAIKNLQYNQDVITISLIKERK